jgi:protein-S-isoprenylcysteine O-methyltransferase Ste14
MGSILQLSSGQRLVLIIVVAAFGAAELVQAFHRRAARAVDVRSELLFRLIFFAGVLMLPVGRWLVPSAVVPGGAWSFGVGAVAGGCGLVLRWWSFVILGRYFTVVVKTSPDQPVIDRGPYRVLRHPSYTGLLLCFAGVGLMLGNWLAALASTIVVLIGVLLRIRVEERALVAALGDRYRAFGEGRARLVPYIW